MRWHLLTVVLTISACQSWDADLEHQITFSCGSTNECPAGQTCVDGRCTSYVGECTKTAKDQCDDHNACTNDTCSDTGSCVHTPAPSGTVCRLSAGPCDEPERCDGSAAPCPADALKPATFECRAAIDLCDEPELCTGNSAACPADVLTPSTFECRGAAGPCDEPELCTGYSAACPADVLMPATLECRAATGLCDEPELCTGNSAACPADAVKAASFVCRDAVDLCDAPEQCTGSSKVCPADLLRPSTFACRSAAGACDAPELCTGSSAACPADVLTTAGTSCTSDGNDCTADVCAGDPSCHHVAVADGASCTGGSCVSGSCANGCWIASALVANGAVNPANECEVCDLQVARTAWSPRAEQSPCTVAGQYCYAGACTAHCSISSSLYPDGTPNPVNPCARCDVAVSSSAWTSSVPSSLVGYWPLDEAAGTTTADLTGHQSGTLEGSPALPTWQVDSVHGSALKFDSQNINDVPRVSLGTYDPVTGGKVTVSLWFKAASGAAGGLQFAKGNDLADGSWRVYTSTVDTGPWHLFSAVTKSLAPTYVATTTAVASAGVWHHHVAAIDGTTIKIYLDGVETASGTVTLALGNPTGTLWLGAQSRVGTYPFPYHGLLDEVSVWGRTLSPAEITSLYNGGSYFAACALGR